MAYQEILSDSDNYSDEEPLLAGEEEDKVLGQFASQHNRFQTLNESIANDSLGYGSWECSESESNVIQGTCSDGTTNKNRFLSGGIFPKPMDFDKSNQFNDSNRFDSFEGSTFCLPKPNSKEEEILLTKSAYGKIWGTTHDSSYRRIKDNNIHSKQTREETNRQEIHNLRETKMFLLEQRCKLDYKLNRVKVFSNEYERKLLEINEALEAVDYTIEFKNNALTGKKGFLNDGLEQGKEVNILENVMSLSEPELRYLVYKYFNKVVDLKETGRNAEHLFAEHEYKIETQKWKIQALCNAIQQCRVESHKKLLTAQHKFEEKVQSFYAEETNNKFGSTSNKWSPLQTHDKNGISFLTDPAVKGSSNKLPIFNYNLKKLQVSSPQVTQVTRIKNKLIIQKSKDN